MARPLVLLAAAAAAALLLREGGCAPIARRRQLQSGGQPEPVPPPFNDTVIAAFRAKELLNPPDVPTENPYDFPPPPPPPGWEEAVCGVLYEDDQARQRYRLETFASREAAGEAGAHVTHLTPCDLCSSLEDLAAYMSHWDMTAPGRACGLQGAISRELGLQCFAELGLTPPRTIAQVTQALEQLMREDAAQQTPFIAALVVSRRGDGLPATGFFELAVALGRFPKDPTLHESAYRAEFQSALNEREDCQR